MTRIDVLDHGFVELIDTMGGDAAVIRAARICYDSESSGEDAKLIQRLMKARHNTPFEHAYFTFKVKAPLAVTRQIMRHRVCSFNERSLRYCTAEREYYSPSDEPGLDAYRRHVESCFDVYEDLCKEGWKKERARFVLPVCVYTTFIWTINCWSLCNFLEKRLDKAAQWETRQYAKALSLLWTEAMPITSAAWRELHYAANMG